MSAKRREGLTGKQYPSVSSVRRQFKLGSVRHFGNCFNAENKCENTGYLVEQSKEKVFLGPLSLVMAEWAAMATPNLKPVWLLDRTELSLISFPQHAVL